MFYQINQIIEFVALLIAYFCLRKKQAGWYRYSIVFLLIVVITECAGSYTYFVLHKNNHWIYNTYLPIEIGFKAWMLYKICQPHFNCKPLVLAGLAVFLISYLAESMRSGFREYSTITNNLFSIWVVLVCFLYYYILIKTDSNISIVKHPPFWIITGLFFFYFVSTASNFFFTYLVDINKLDLVPIRYSIFMFLNLILYGTWSYAFICQHKNPISF